MMQNILFIIFIACAIAFYLIGRFGLENIKKYLHLIVLGFALFILQMQRAREDMLEKE